jgi:DNA-binding CsgD family transcriptional regulator
VDTVSSGKPVLAFAVDAAGVLVGASADLSPLLRPQAPACDPCHACVALTDLADGTPTCRPDCPLLAAAVEGRPAALERLVAVGDGTRAAHLLAVAAPAGGEGYRVVHVLSFSPALDRLTPTERRVLALILAGCGTRGIGRALGVRPSTVRTHIRHILEKTGAERRIEAVRKALQDPGGEGTSPPF